MMFISALFIKANNCNNLNVSQRAIGWGNGGLVIQWNTIQLIEKETCICMYHYEVISTIYKAEKASYRVVSILGL